MNVDHDCGITTTRMLNDMESIAAAYHNIKKAKLSIRRWTKSHNEGTVTTDAYNIAIEQARRLIQYSFEVGCESGMACGQNDALTYEERSKKHTEDLLHGTYAGTNLYF